MKYPNILLLFIFFLSVTSIYSQSDKDRWYNLSYEEEQVILDMRYGKDSEVQTLQFEEVSISAVDYQNPFTRIAYQGSNNDYQTSGFIDGVKKVWQIGNALFGGSIRSMIASYLDEDCQENIKRLAELGKEYIEKAIEFFEFQQTVRP